jgi:short-subunit dehydrogenase
MNLQPKYGIWALVTGASSGIGRAFANQLAQQGIDLILVARREERLNQIADSLEADYHINTKVLALDLANETGRRALYDQTSELDIGLIVAAAGFGTSGRFTESNIDQELELIEVNCKSVIDQCHHFANRFKARGGGGIILFSSIVAFQGVPFSANYAASKAYIQSFGEALEQELKTSDIDVLVSAPGPTATEFGDVADMDMKNAESPEVVARSSLSKLGKASTDRPGITSKILGYSLATLPRGIRVFIMSKIMSGMAQSV